MSKPSRRTILNQRRRPPSRPLPVIRPRYLRNQLPRDPHEGWWIAGFLVASVFFLLTAEHWGFRIAVGIVVLIGFFVYLALV